MIVKNTSYIQINRPTIEAFYRQQLSVGQKVNYIYSVVEYDEDGKKKRVTCNKKCAVIGVFPHHFVLQSKYYTISVSYLGLFCGQEKIKEVKSFEREN